MMYHMCTVCVTGGNASELQLSHYYFVKKYVCVSEKDINNQLTSTIKKTHNINQLVLQRMPNNSWVRVLEVLP